MAKPVKGAETVSDTHPHLDQQDRDFLDDHTMTDPQPAYDDPTERTD